MSRLDEIRARNAAARAEYASGEPDQTVRDIDHLLSVIDDQQRRLYNYAREDADAFIQRQLEEAQTRRNVMPRGAWLWPDDRTGPEWMTEHDERL